MGFLWNHLGLSKDMTTHKKQFDYQGHIACLNVTLLVQKQAKDGKVYFCIRPFAEREKTLNSTPLF